MFDGRVTGNCHRTVFYILSTTYYEVSFEKILKSIDIILITRDLIELSTGHSLQSSNVPTNLKLLTTVHSDSNLLKSTLDFVAYVKTLCDSDDSKFNFDSCIFLQLCKTIVNEKNVISLLSSARNRNVDRFEKEKCVLKRMFMLCAHAHGRLSRIHNSSRSYPCKCVF